MLDLPRLQVLLQVRRHGSISAAAVALGISQPAASRQVVRLEAEVGAELILRLPTGVRLTEAGVRLAEHAETILADVARAEHDLGELTQLETTPIRLGFFSTAATIVHNAVRQMRALNPHVEIHAIEGEPAETVAKLTAGELDLGLICLVDHRDLDSQVRFDRTFLFHDAMYVALPAGHPLATSDEEVTIEALAHEAWGCALADDHPCSILLHRAFAEIGQAPRLTFRSNDYQVVQELVAAGVGLGLVPDLAIDGHRTDLAFRQIPGAARRVEVVAAPRIRPESPTWALVDILVGLGTRTVAATVAAAPDALTTTPAAPRS